MFVRRQVPFAVDDLRVVGCGRGHAPELPGRPTGPVAKPLPLDGCGTQRPRAAARRPSNVEISPASTISSAEAAKKRRPRFATTQRNGRPASPNRRSARRQNGGAPTNVSKRKTHADDRSALFLDLERVGQRAHHRHADAKSPRFPGEAFIPTPRSRRPRRPGGRRRRARPRPGRTEIGTHAEPHWRPPPLQQARSSRPRCPPARAGPRHPAGLGDARRNGGQAETR